MRQRSAPVPRSRASARASILLWLAFAAGITGCSDDSGSRNKDENPANDDSDDDTGMDAGAAGRRDAGKGSDAGSAGGNRDGGGTTPRRDGGGGGGGGGGSGSDGDGTQPGGGDSGGGGEPGACDPSTGPAIPALALEPVVTGLEIVVFAAQPPGSSDWYLVQQPGTIRVFSNGQLLSKPFLDVSSQVTISGNPATNQFDDERGLLSVAFPPDYESSGKFYIMMTPTSGAAANRDTIVEYARSASDPNVADASSAKTLLQLDASDVNHNGGNLVFGPDGMLYAGTGDGGGSCNSSKPGAPQDTNALFGKILRLDPNASAPNYAAAGNPFASGGDARVWHYGLRNPFRFAFDRETGDMYIGDVGQDSYEELDFAPSGASGLNFGWVAFEGKHPPPSPCTAGMLKSQSTHTEPIFEADRRRGQTGPYADWTSAIGGRVYRGSAIPQLKGVYLAGDYEGRRMVAMQRCGEQFTKETAILKNRDPNSPNTPSFARASGDPSFNQVSAIVEDNEGELYFVVNFDRLLKVVPGD